MHTAIQKIKVALFYGPWCSVRVTAILCCTSSYIACLSLPRWMIFVGCLLEMQLWPEMLMSKCVCVMFSPEHTYSAGVANDKLSYYDGMLKLVYRDDDSYHSRPQVKRRTEIFFMCDYNAGVGSPYFKVETSHTYTIEWYTALACLPRTLECSVTDEDQGLYYDLTRLEVCTYIVTFVKALRW